MVKAIALICLVSLANQIQGLPKYQANELKALGKDLMSMVDQTTSDVAQVSIFDVSF